MNIYQAKVMYAKIGHGTTTENYFVKAHNLTEAEVLIKEEVQKRVAKKKFDNVIHAGQYTEACYYIAKVVEKDEKETLHKCTFLVRAPTLGEAYETIYDEIPCERTISFVKQDDNRNSNR